MSRASELPLFHVVGFSGHRQVLSWHAILPLPKAEFANDFSPADWPRVESLLGHAEHVRVITENGSREDAYLDCGMETVSGSDVLLAVWDGEAARGKGGTGDVVDYIASEPSGNADLRSSALIQSAEMSAY